jgi:hypothetical protein
LIFGEGALKCIRHSELVFALVLLFLGASGASALDVTIVQGQTCPSGSRLMTYQEALAEQNKVCHSMGQWYIGRLAENASIDGPGYSCKIRQGDNRPLTNAVCVAAAAPSWSVSAIHNNSGHELSIYVPIRDRQTLTATNAFGVGRIALDASDFGLIKFSESSRFTSVCGGSFWRVRIVSQRQRLSYFFDRAGTIDLTVNSDGNLAIVPSAGGQVVSGDAGPHC